MTVSLTNTVSTSYVIDEVKMNAIFIDFDEESLDITYSALSNGVVVKEATIIVDDYTDVLTDIAILNGNNIVPAFKQGLYNKVLAETGFVGVIS